MDVWLNRHVMIAVTTMMLAAEVFGYDTAPMEGFDPDGVKREFGIPDEAEVVCLLPLAPDASAAHRGDGGAVDRLLLKRGGES
jgi:nitroreductase